MFQLLLLLLLLYVSNAQPTPPVDIMPDKFIFDYTLENGFDNGDSLASANTILFDVELSDPIICADQTQDCTLVLEFTASDDPRLTAPDDVIWDATNDPGVWTVWQENRSFLLTYVPDAHCESGFVGNGLDIFDVFVRSGSELYNMYRPSFNITLPPTSLYNCEDTTDDDDDGPDLTALYVLLVVAMVAFIILAILCSLRQRIYSLRQINKTQVSQENDSQASRTTKNIELNF
jgi:hypothetical protein